MPTLVRVLVLLTVALTVVYVSVLFFLRARMTERLSARWEAEGRQGDRQAYLDAGLAHRMPRLKRWLVLGVYVAPLSLGAWLGYTSG